MPIKLTYEYVRDYINKEHILISTEYINNSSPLEILCNKCNKIYTQCFGAYNRGCRCRSCSMKANANISVKKRYGEFYNKTKHKICIFCNREYDTIINNQKFCSKSCSIKNVNKDKDKDKHKQACSKGGTNSAKSQQRRSKNEIAFSEKCKEYFGENEVICNEAIFKDKNGNYWDCDIYIKKLKIAILWDGYYWHYSNKATQKQKARDKLKRQIILDNGCEYYTIIDYGKHNMNFVDEQFNLFNHKLKFKTVLCDISRI